MNHCDSKYAPMYKIKYESAALDDVVPEWIVCEKCFEDENFLADLKKSNP
ncbi:MAG: hypothetical protein OPY06_05660 [Nitrosopumilus sp.]|nr:hypothetical protein [Nitrosopumilus sp.]MDF2422716.1 hypothetical protein [Nitrosopumilus sp.]MDF2424575.1 hypothetical protein [Nitrosopumilus sp.]MDF2425924.1 hypothetical protein [Nitrosopumilus sp.]MDF2426963.1 hypothetical protein [Nitrosopumilus sp.]